MKVRAKVETTDDAAVAVVRVTGTDARRDVTVRRSSKRHPKDQPDTAIGADLAMGRALIAAGQELVDRAERWMEPVIWRPMAISFTESTSHDGMAEHIAKALRGPLR